jgi:hypothetical protein
MWVISNIQLSAMRTGIFAACAVSVGGQVILCNRAAPDGVIAADPRCQTSLAQAAAPYRQAAAAPPAHLLKKLQLQGGEGDEHSA